MFHLYLEDSCSSRKWVDEKKYRAFVTKLISVFKYASFPISTLGTKGCPYSEAELHAIFTLAVDYMSPLVERPLSQIVDGIVMTSCTLSSIPSFTVRVVSVLKVGPVFRSNVGVAEHSAHPQLLPEARRAHPAVHLRSSHPSPPP